MKELIISRCVNQRSILIYMDHAYSRPSKMAVFLVRCARHLFSIYISYLPSESQATNNFQVIVSSNTVTMTTFTKYLSALVHDVKSILESYEKDQDYISALSKVIKIALQ